MVVLWKGYLSDILVEARPSLVTALYIIVLFHDGKLVWGLEFVEKVGNRSLDS